MEIKEFIEKKEVMKMLKRRIENANDSPFDIKHKNTEKNLLWSIWDEIEPRPTGQA